MRSSTSSMGARMPAPWTATRRCAPAAVLRILSDLRSHCHYPETARETENAWTDCILRLLFEFFHVAPRASCLLSRVSHRQPAVLPCHGHGPPARNARSLVSEPSTRAAGRCLERHEFRLGRAASARVAQATMGRAGSPGLRRCQMPGQKKPETKSIRDRQIGSYNDPAHRHGRQAALKSGNASQHGPDSTSAR